jgi:hypothetical protein
MQMVVATNPHPHRRSRQSPASTAPEISKCLYGLILLLWIVCCFYYNHVIMTTLVGCSHNDSVTNPSEILARFHFKSEGESVTAKSKDVSICQAEYNRIVSQQTPGLTPQDLLRSRALIGNQYRLERVMKALSSRERPVVAVVAGGSISLGHGLENPNQNRYSNRLQTWMNDMYPLLEGSTTIHDINSKAERNNDLQKHTVINV